jgi:methylmalonyl-CoA epimerase
MPKSIHHVAIVVHDLDQALAFYRDALGLEVADRRRVPEEGVEIAFLPTGEAEVELIQPLSEEGGVARFLQKRGEGLHHICLALEDAPGGLEAAIARLKAADARVLSEEPQVGADGTRYVFIHPKSAHGVLIELYEAPE